MLKKISVSLLIGITFIYLAYSLANMQQNSMIKVYANMLNPFAQSEVECLANNIFFESAYEPEKGQIAVAFVTLNRVNSGIFPDNICDVVKQRTQHVCQFSWYCEPTPRRISYTKDLTNAQKVVYNEIYELAIHVYANYEKMKDPTKGALFYHADYVNPRWKNMIKTAVIGRHIFYNRKDLMT
jgi:N-acetylmuramoyl-L-alanine amidase